MLLVDVRSDLVPDVEFDEIRAEAMEQGLFSRFDASAAEWASARWRAG